MSRIILIYSVYFLVILCGLAQIKEDYSFCTVSETNQDNISALECSPDTSQNCYCSLVPLADIKNNTIVLACKKYYFLQFTVNFDDVDNTGIIGPPGGTTFNCSNKSGLIVTHSRNILFQRITFLNCDAQFFRERSGTPNSEIRAAAIFYNTSGIIFQKIFVCGYSSGAVLINSQGSFSNSRFDGHSISEEEIGSTGLHAEFDNEYHYTTINIQVTNCTFQENKATRKFSYISCDTGRISIGSRGGGLALYLRKRDKVINTSVQIHNSTFSSNNAIFGGGMFIFMCTSKGTTNISITNTTFSHNIAKHFGGGLDITLEDAEKDLTQTRQHSCKCYSCLFYGNKAYYGAGSAFYTTDFLTSTSVTFENSSWIMNEAAYGMAFDLRPEGTIKHKGRIVINFVNTSFERNHVLKDKNHVSSMRGELCPISQTIKGKGVFLVSGLNIVFKGIINFKLNNDSALYAISSILEFIPHTMTTFQENRGVTGAAMALIGTSAIHVHYNVSFQMLNNTALSMGGAIYHESLYNHDYAYLNNCFIQLAQGKNDTLNTGILFNFSGNMAGSKYDGDSIFATTFIPCLSYCNVKEIFSLTDIFGCIGQFNYCDKNVTFALATRAGCIIKQTHVTNLDLIPGFSSELDFKNLNDLYQEVQGIYHITSSDTSKVIIDEASTYTAIKAVVVKGKPGDSANITITNVDVREAAITYLVLLHPCPPLFIYNPDSSICECYSDNSMQHDYRYICDGRNRSAKLLHGYWLGTPNNSDEGWYSGYCPLTYCYNGNEQERYHLMPREIEDLDGNICSNSGRTGTLCGSCKENLSVHYHSDTFLCRGEETCSYGWFLYILSEVAPLTVMFFVIMAFKISLTSGHLNGFLFFAQTYDSVFVIGKAFVYYPTPAYRLVKTIQTIYKFFNLDFFGIDAMSFCLWSGATTLHMLAFKYVTVVITFLLVMFVVVTLNKLPLLSKTLLYTPGSSIVHGLATFLVLVYMQGTKISFDILRYTSVAKLNGTNQTLVVFFQGNTHLFSDEHKPYAAIAVLFLIFITFLPPFLLIVYPLCYKLPSFLRIENLKVITFVSNLPMSRLKPMFDAFQGTFEDKYRYFAGLYFGYRLLLLLATFSPRITHIYIIVLIEFSSMLVIHVICYPYIRRAHNITNAVIFGNLSVVSLLSLLNYTYSKYGSSFQSMINIVSYFIVFLLYFPLLCLSSSIVLHFCKYYLNKKKLNISKPDDEDTVLDQIDDRDNGKSFDYKHFNLDIIH